MVDEYRLRKIGRVYGYEGSDNLGPVDGVLRGVVPFEEFAFDAIEDLLDKRGKVKTEEEIEDFVSSVVRRCELMMGAMKDGDSPEETLNQLGEMRDWAEKWGDGSE